FRIFRHHKETHAKKIDHGAKEGWSTRTYRRAMTALVHRPLARWGFCAFVAALFVAAAGMVYFGLVKVKMLPFDNKSELQVMIDQDEGTPLEVTLETARQMSRALASEPEVRNIQIYAGTAAPFNFNGLVRHYFLRRGPNLADIQVNLVGKSDRHDQDHA